MYFCNKVFDWSKAEAFDNTLAEAGYYRRICGK